jgi:hypothetical protein
MAMETIDKIISFAGAIVERFPAQSPMDATAFSEMIIVSILLSAAPTRFVVVFGTIILGLLVLLAPHAIILFAIGCGLTGLMHYRHRSTMHRSAMVQKQLDELKRSVHGLELAANSLLIRSLNAPVFSTLNIEEKRMPSIVPRERGEKEIDSAVNPNGLGNGPANSARSGMRA